MSLPLQNSFEFLNIFPGDDFNNKKVITIVCFCKYVMKTYKSGTCFANKLWHTPFTQKFTVVKE